MTVPATDAWNEADPTLCDVCGRESCEDHLPPSSQEINREARISAAVESERVKREARRRLDAEERPAAVIPEFESLRARLARPARPLRHRIQGWQLRGHHVMVAAQFKSGKTTLIANYVRSVIDGDPFLGRYDVEAVAGSVAVVDLEMSGDHLASWYRTQRIQNDDRVWLIPLRGQAASFNPLDPENRSIWASKFRDRATEVLVVDCYRPLSDALGLDEHKDGGRLLLALDALVGEAGISECVLVHHMGHNGERARGDSRLRDWPDVEWRLVRRDDDPSSPRFITAYGRDVDIPESQLVYDTLTRRLTIEDGSRRDAAGYDALEAIAVVLEDCQAAMSGRAVKEALMGSKHSREAIEAGLRVGAQTGRFRVEDGPRRARLYSPLSRVSHECPADSVSECPAAYIERDTHTLTGTNGHDRSLRTLIEDRP